MVGCLRFQDVKVEPRRKCLLTLAITATLRCGGRGAREDGPEEKWLEEIALLLSQTHSLPHIHIEDEMLVGSAPVAGRMLERWPMHGVFVTAIRVSGFCEARPIARHG